MTLDCELLMWFSILFTVISTELTRVHESKHGIIALVQSFVLGFFLSFVFITSIQIQTFILASTFIFCIMFLIYSIIKDDLSFTFKRFFIVDVGIFQGVCAVLVYKFV